MHKSIDFKAGEDDCRNGVAYQYHKSIEYKRGWNCQFTAEKDLQALGLGKTAKQKA